MSTPLPSDVHVNRPLTNVVVAFLQNQNNFVANKVFPIVQSSHKSDIYSVFPRGSFNRDEMKLRGLSSESAGGSFTVDNSNSFICQDYGLHKDIDDTVRANQDSQINIDRAAALWVAQQAMIRQEKMFASSFMATSIWGLDITGVSSGPTGNQVLQWNDASSTPIEDVAAGIDRIVQNTGYMPNTLVIGQQVYTALKNHPDIIGRISGGATVSNPAIATLNQIAAVLDVERVLVSRAIENTAKEGATDVHSFITGKQALLCYSAPAPSIMAPSAGYTFAWTGMMGATEDGYRVKRFRVENFRSDRIEIELMIAQKLISSDLGYFFTSVVA